MISDAGFLGREIRVVVGVSEIMPSASFPVLSALLVAFVSGLWLLLYARRKRRLGRGPGAKAGAREAGRAERASNAQDARGMPLIVLGRPRATRHPILLAHGWFGFDRIGVARLGQDYFRGIPKRLEALGHSVYVARVSSVGGIRVRAAQLARQIEQLGPRVNIIAHSMGGLDARLAIARHNLGGRVASLTTIGTPHHGTPLADMALTFGEFRNLRRLLDTFGLNVDGLYDVSTARMRAFNHAILDSPEVVYASVVGAVNLETLGVHAMLSAGHSYLLRRAGPNDGVVPALSQLWGEPFGEIDADHWAQIGWSGGFDVLGFYARLAEWLRDRGL